MQKFFIAMITLLLVISCQNAEDKAWNEALKHHSIGAIDSFLLIYPDSKYMTDAVEQKDKYAWYITKQANTIYNYKKYLADYPDGLFKDEVPSCLDSIPTDNINLSDLTTSSFVGKIDYGNRETQIINFKFAEIQEDETSIRFFAKINTSDIRKNLEGKINKKDFSVMFMEDSANKTMLNLTDGRIYKKQNKLIMESVNISQYWNLVKYNE